MAKLSPLIPVKVAFPLFFQSLSLSTFPTLINGLKDSVFKLLILGQLGNGEFLHPDVGPSVDNSPSLLTSHFLLSVWNELPKNHLALSSF